MNRREVLAIAGASILGRVGLARLLVTTPRLSAAAGASGISAWLAGCKSGSGASSAASSPAPPSPLPPSPVPPTPPAPEPVPVPMALPAWLKGTPVLQWTQISNTAMATIRSSPDYARIKDAGLDPGDGSYGDPEKGIYAYSGGTIKGGHTMLVFGGGGAGGWAGNDIRALDLSADAPVWRIPVAPSPASAVWDRRAPGRTSHVYMQDGKPNARHSYWGPQFIDSHGPYANSFFIFMCGQVWETDADMAYPDQQTVDSLDWKRAPGARQAPILTSRPTGPGRVRGPASTR